MYSSLRNRLDSVLNNILDSLSKEFTSADFIKAAKDYASLEIENALTHATMRTLHVWIARWYLNGKQEITQNGSKPITTINGNKSRNKKWINPRKK